MASLYPMQQKPPAAVSVQTQGLPAAPRNHAAIPAAPIAEQSSNLPAGDALVSGASEDYSPGDEA